MPLNARLPVSISKSTVPKENRRIAAGFAPAPGVTINAMSHADRRSRAEARQGRAILRKSRLERAEGDLTPMSGPDAVSLVRQLTSESWSLAGLELPSYTRDRIPWRFVPGRSA